MDLTCKFLLLLMHGILALLLVSITLSSPWDLGKEELSHLCLDVVSVRLSHVAYKPLD